MIKITTSRHVRVYRVDEIMKQRNVMNCGGVCCPLYKTRGKERSKLLLYRDRSCDLWEISRS
jgi:hypothetical protein